jgi:hypothetical protein
MTVEILGGYFFALTLALSQRERELAPFEKGRRGILRWSILLRF